MVELNEEARNYLTSDDALTALMAQYGSPTMAATSSAIDYGLPIVVAGLERRAEDSAGIVNLLNLVRSLDTSQLGTAAVWSRTSHRTVMGPDLVEILFRDERGQATHDTVIRKLSERARVSPEAARGLLGSCAWMMLAVLVNRYSRSLDRQTLLRVADQERRLLSEQGWDPWIRAVEAETAAIAGNETLYVGPSAPMPRVAPMVASDDRASRYPPPVSRGERPAPTYTPDRAAPRRGADRPDPSSTAAAGRGPYGSRGQGTGYSPPLGGDYGDYGEYGDYEDYGDYRGDPAARPRPMASTSAPARHTRPRIRVPEPEPRRWPIAAAVAALIVIAGGAWWVLGRDDGSATDTEAAQDEQVAAPAEETGDAVATDDGSAAEEDPAGAEMVDPGSFTGLVIMDVPMRDIFSFDQTEAVGSVMITIDSLTGEACALVSTENLAGPYRSHIHLGSYPENGPIVVDWSPMEDGVEACVPNDIDDVQEMLADPSEYYVEMHDAGETFTVRGQLSEADPVDDQRDPALIPDLTEDGTAAFDTDPDPVKGGAVVRFQGSSLLAQGVVADQMVVDELISSLEAAGVDVINELRVEPGAPLPSGRFVANEGLTFPVGGDQLEGDNSAVLDTMADVLKANPSWKLTVVGHTDDTGSRVANLELSRRRAVNVRAALEDLGVATDVLKIAGFGPDQPVADNSTPEGRRRNRRIEFIIDPT